MSRYREHHDREIARMLNPDGGLSGETFDLLNLSLDNPEAYWRDVDDWIESGDPIRAAEGNLIAGAVWRTEDPIRAVAHFEEARRLYVGQNYYAEAGTAAHILFLLYAHETEDEAVAELHRQLAWEYRAIAKSGKHPRIEPRIMDDDHD